MQQGPHDEMPRCRIDSASRHDRRVWSDWPGCSIAANRPTGARAGSRRRSRRAAARRAWSSSPTPPCSTTPTPKSPPAATDVTYGVVASVGVNSRGHAFVYHRSPVPIAEFDAKGTFVRGLARRHRHAGAQRRVRRGRQHVARRFGRAHGHEARPDRRCAPDARHEWCERQRRRKPPRRRCSTSRRMSPLRRTATSSWRKAKRADRTRASFASIRTAGSSRRGAWPSPKACGRIRTRLRWTQPASSTWRTAR